MKRSLLTAFLTVFITCTLFSQSYYRYQGKKVDLKTDSEMFVVQVEQQFAETQLMVLDKQLQKGDIKLYKKIASNRFLVYGLIPQTRNDSYLSNVYRKDSTGMIIILPRIVIMLKQGNVIDPILEKYEGELIKESGTNLKYVLKCKASQSDDVLQLVNELDAREEVDWCEPEFLSDYQTTNTLYPQQYYLKNIGQNGGTAGIDINIEPTWNITNGNACITVAVIDVGVDRNHEDMGNRVVAGFTIRNQNGLGEPQNVNTLDNKAHGMACAGIIAASNNTIGIRGIASNVNVLPVNIVPDAAFEFNGQVIYGFGTNIEIAQAINWAWRRADVLSCSWGGGLPSNDITAAIDSARNFGRNGRGTVVVFASGNNWPGATDVAYPGRADGVITVGAINNQGAIWNYSQRGISMDLVTPSGNVSSGDVRSTDRMGNLGYNTNGNYMDNFGGTSAACPQVAGVAALMLSVRPDLTETQIRTTLQQTATDIGATGFDNTFGFGRLDAFAAIQAIAPVLSGPSTVCSTGATFIVNNLPAGDTVRWTCSSNITFDHQPGNPKVFTAIGIGTSTITATINSTTCGSVTLPAKMVWVGVPTVPLDIFGIQNGWEFWSETYNDFTVNSAYVQNASQYNWVVRGGILVNGQGTPTITYKTAKVPAGAQKTFDISVKVGNTCGWGSYLMRSGYVNPPPAASMFVIYPNPATSEVTVSVSAAASIISKSENEDVEIKTLDIIDFYGNRLMMENYVKGQKSANLNVSGFQKGTYFVIVNSGSTEEKHTLLVE